jgi:hypothetical protein
MAKPPVFGVSADGFLDTIIDRGKDSKIQVKGYGELASEIFLILDLNKL